MKTKTFPDWLLSRQLPAESQLSFILLFFRIFAGLLMIPYGYGKIMDYDKYTVDFFGDPIGIGMVPSLILTIFAQIGCAIFLIVGFQTRLSALVLAFNMLIATKFHFFDPFSVKALPLLFLGIYLIITMLGGGKYTLDSLLFRSKTKRNDPLFSKADVYNIASLLIAFGLYWIGLSNYFSGLPSFLFLSIATLLILVSFLRIK